MTKFNFKKKKVFVIVLILLVLIGTLGIYFSFVAQTEKETPSITGKEISEVQKEPIIKEPPEEKTEEPIIEEPIEEYIIPNPPKTIKEFQSFIRPLEAKPFVDELNFSGSYDSLGNYVPLTMKEEFKKIRGIIEHFRYWEDEYIYGREDYWATPSESIPKMKGDEEDWAIALVSLMLARNSTSKCYIVGNNEFNGGVFCYLEETDQFYRFVNNYLNGRVSDIATLAENFFSIDKGYTEQEITIALRESRDDFLENDVRYCCDGKLSNKMITFAYNKDEDFEFETREDFISWLKSFRD